ncbi:MAG: hypothetical protein IJR50_08995 [Treponema sp.]|nr:hypothetical protein [Treponema sp.]
MNAIANKLLLLVIYSACIFSSCTEKKEPYHSAVRANRISDFFFEMLRCEVTGYTADETAAQCAPAIACATKIFMSPVLTSRGTIVYAIENVVPSYTGKIDATFSPDDIVVSSFDAIDAALASFFQSDGMTHDFSEIAIEAPVELADVPDARAELSGTLSAVQTESPAERRFRDAQGRLRFFSYDVERLAVSSHADGHVLVRFSDGAAARNYYDEHMRLVKKELWRIGSSLSESARESSEIFYYNDDDPRPFSSIMEKEDYRIETLYNENGKAISAKGFFLDNKARRIPDVQTVWRYASDGKLAEQEYTRFEYGDGQKQIATGKTTRREVYSCSAGAGAPDYAYYEDGVLRMKTEHIDDNSYVTTLYFEGGYAVVSVYSNGRKMQETISLNGTVMRSSSYE